MENPPSSPVSRDADRAPAGPDWVWARPGESGVLAARLLYFDTRWILSLTNVSEQIVVFSDTGSQHIALYFEHLLAPARLMHLRALTPSQWRCFVDSRLECLIITANQRQRLAPGDTATIMLMGDAPPPAPASRFEHAPFPKQASVVLCHVDPALFRRGRAQCLPFHHVPQHTAPASIAFMLRASRLCADGRPRSLMLAVTPAARLAANVELSHPSRAASISMPATSVLQIRFAPAPDLTQDIELWRSGLAQTHLHVLPSEQSWEVSRDTDDRGLAIWRIVPLGDQVRLSPEGLRVALEGVSMTHASGVSLIVESLQTEAGGHVAHTFALQSYTPDEHVRLLAAPPRQEEQQATRARLLALTSRQHLHTQATQPISAPSSRALAAQTRYRVQFHIFNGLEVDLKDGSALLGAHTYYSPTLSPTTTLDAISAGQAAFRDMWTMPTHDIVTLSYKVGAANRCAVRITLGLPLDGSVWIRARLANAWDGIAHSATALPACHDYDTVDRLALFASVARDDAEIRVEVIVTDAALRHAFSSTLEGERL